MIEYKDDVYFGDSPRIPYNGAVSARCGAQDTHYEKCAKWCACWCHNIERNTLVFAV